MLETFYFKINHKYIIFYYLKMSFEERISIWISNVMTALNVGHTEDVYCTAFKI